VGPHDFPRRVGRLSIACPASLPAALLIAVADQSAMSSGCMVIALWFVVLRMIFPENRFTLFRIMR